MADEMDVWTVVEAKARLSELLERAERRGPQRVTRHGRDYAVVVGAADWAHGGRRRSILAVLTRAGGGFALDDDHIAELFPRLGYCSQAPDQGPAA